MGDESEAGGGTGEKNPREFCQEKPDGQRTTEQEKVEKQEKYGEGEECGFDKQGGSETEDGERDAEKTGSAGCGYRGGWRRRIGRFPVRGSAEIGEEGKKGEKEGEDVLAFGNPGHGFDTEGMDGPEEGEEERRKRKAGCRTTVGPREGQDASQATEEEEDEDCVEGVENDVDGMEGGGVRWRAAPKGNIDHIGNPEERHIHGTMEPAGKGVQNAARREAGEDEGVFRDVVGVIQGKEPVADGGGVEGKDGEEEEDGEPGKDERAETAGEEFHGEARLAGDGGQDNPKTGQGAGEGMRE